MVFCEIYDDPIGRNCGEGIAREDPRDLPAKKCTFCTSGVKLTPVKDSYFRDVFAVLFFKLLLT